MGRRGAQRGHRGTGTRGWGQAREGLGGTAGGQAVTRGAGDTHGHHAVVLGRVEVALQLALAEADGGVAGGLAQPRQAGGDLLPLQVLQLLQLLPLPRLLLGTDGPREGTGGQRGEGQMGRDPPDPPPVCFPPLTFFFLSRTFSRFSLRRSSRRRTEVAMLRGYVFTWGGARGEHRRRPPVVPVVPFMSPTPHLLGPGLLEAKVVAALEVLLPRQEELALVRGIGHAQPRGGPGGGTRR